MRLSMCWRTRLDCFVVASCQKDTESLKRIGEARCPTGSPSIEASRGFASNFVGVNDFRIGELATEHLVAQGYKRIAHIRGPATKVGNNRAEGYRKTIERHGLPLRDQYVIACGEASDSDGETRGRKAMGEVLALRPRPDALFCFNDTIAVGAMERAFEDGLRIPKDMAIVGCGNFHYSSKLQVPLTSIDQRSQRDRRSAQLQNDYNHA